jgi:hypothetical protein
LHLSRECNTPELAESTHSEWVTCAVTAASHASPVGPITLAPSAGYAD